jgi:hypothetical protein
MYPNQKVLSVPVQQMKPQIKEIQLFQALAKKREKPVRQKKRKRLKNSSLPL